MLQARQARLPTRFSSLLFGGVLLSVGFAVGTPADEILHTKFYPFEKEGILLRPFVGTGGAIATLDRDLLVVTPRGKIALLRPGAKEEVYVAGSVPMRQSDWDTLTNRDSLNVVGTIRVAGIVLKECGLGKFDLFVAHHYFTGECIQFRLSSATLVRGGGGGVSPLTMANLVRGRAVLGSRPFADWQVSEPGSSGGRDVDR